MGSNRYVGTQTEKNLLEAFSGESQAKGSGEFLHIKMATGHVRFGCHFCMG